MAHKERNKLFIFTHLSKQLRVSTVFLRFCLFLLLFACMKPATAQVCRVHGDHGSHVSWNKADYPLALIQRVFPKHIGLAFHVLHKGGEENISLEAIRAQVDVLNEAFTGTEFSFYLALVTRTENEAWLSLSDEGVPSLPIRNALMVDTDHVINVFIGDMQREAIGWSVFTDSPDPKSHAIVLDFVALPGGPFDPDYDSGITLAHEMGHYFSLRHPYERGCLPDPTKGDFVADTPPTSNSWFRQCPTVADSCPDLPGNDPVTNYMYATTDACRSTWSAGQIDRMQAKVAEFRPDIGGAEINLPASLTIESNSEWFFFEGNYLFPEDGQLTVHGSLHAEDVVFTSTESHWRGIRFTEGSFGSLHQVEITRVSDQVQEAVVSLDNARAVLDSVFIDVLPGSSAGSIYAVGPSSTLYLHQSYINQQSSSASIRVADAGTIHFGRDSSLPGAGLNRIAGGKLVATGNGVIHAGSDSEDSSHNHFCDAASSELETRDGGVIHAGYNYWYNAASPLLSGTNILFEPVLGGSDCSDTPVVDVSVERELPQAGMFDLQNRPNPFSQETTISFELPASGHVQLVVYDMLGRPVITLLDEVRVQGLQEIQLEAIDLPSGIYLTRLATVQGSTTQLISVVK